MTYQATAANEGDERLETDLQPLACDVKLTSKQISSSLHGSNSKKMSCTCNNLDLLRPQDIKEIPVVPKVDRIPLPILSGSPIRPITLLEFEERLLQKQRKSEAQGNASDSATDIGDEIDFKRERYLRALKSRDRWKQHLQRERMAQVAKEIGTVRALDFRNQKYGSYAPLVNVIIPYRRWPFSQDDFAHYRPKIQARTDGISATTTQHERLTDDHYHRQRQQKATTPTALNSYPPRPSISTPQAVDRKQLSKREKERQESNNSLLSADSTEASDQYLETQNGLFGRAGRKSDQSEKVRAPK